MNTFIFVHSFQFLHSFFFLLVKKTNLFKKQTQTDFDDRFSFILGLILINLMR
jgi:hypothetical protein